MTWDTQPLVLGFLYENMDLAKNQTVKRNTYNIDLQTKKINISGTPHEF